MLCWCGRGPTCFLLCPAALLQCCRPAPALVQGWKKQPVMQTADRRVSIAQPELLGAVFAQLGSWAKNRRVEAAWAPQGCPAMAPLVCPYGRVAAGDACCWHQPCQCTGRLLRPGACCHASCTTCSTHVPVLHCPGNVQVHSPPCLQQASAGGRVQSLAQSSVGGPGGCGGPSRKSGYLQWAGGRCPAAEPARFPATAQAPRLRCHSV